MNDVAQIQYRFTIEEGDLSFSDALYFDLDKWPVSKTKLDQLTKERFDNWKEAVKTAPEEVSVEEQIAAIDEQINNLTQQKASYQTQKASSGGGK